MRFLPTSLHAVLDYLWGGVLVASPFVLGFAAGTPLALATAFGAGAIAYSLLTAYEGGLLRIVPMRLHLGLDALAGGLLALSPLALPLPGPAAWTFGLFGTFSVVAAFVTRVEPPAPART